MIPEEKDNALSAKNERRKKHAGMEQKYNSSKEKSRH